MTDASHDLASVLGGKDDHASVDAFQGALAVTRILQPCLEVGAEWLREGFEMPREGLVPVHRMGHVVDRLVGQPEVIEDLPASLLTQSTNQDLPRVDRAHVVFLFVEREPVAKGRGGLRGRRERRLRL